MPYPVSSLTDEQNLYWIFYDMFSSVSIWLLIFLCIVTALVPDVLFILYENFSQNRMTRDNKLENTIGSESPKFTHENKGFRDDENMLNKDDNSTKISTNGIEIALNQTNKRDCYYQTVVTKIDQDVVFNTLV